MKSRPLIVALLFVATLLTGCVDIATDLAMRPYDKAMQQGRLSPGEYRAMRDQMERAAVGQSPR